MEKIYMIPVNDAYGAADGCPLCQLRDKAEQNYLEYYLGPSLMEPDTRKITNKTGFCDVMQNDNGETYIIAGITSTGFSLFKVD